jgi:putative aldouronate transport system permease protein
MLRRIDWFACFNAVVLFVVVVSTLYPFVYMASISLSSEYYVIKNEVFLYPKGFNLDTYATVLGDKRIWIGYYNTIRYVALGTLIALFATATGAYALAKPTMPLRKLLLVAIVCTMFFKGGIIPTFLVVNELGLLNSIWAMVLPGAVSTMYLLIMRSFFLSIPHELEESGRIDGLNDIGLFWRITLPLSKPAIASIGMFYAILIWNNFFSPLLYLRDVDLMPLQVVLRNLVMAGVQNTQTGSLGGDDVVLEDPLKYATILVATIPILLAYPLIQKYFVKGVMIGAVKG